MKWISTMKIYSMASCTLYNQPNITTKIKIDTVLRNYGSSGRHMAGETLLTFLLENTLFQGPQKMNVEKCIYENSK